MYVKTMVSLYIKVRSPSKNHGYVIELFFNSEEVILLPQSILTHF